MHILKTAVFFFELHLFNRCFFIEQRAFLFLNAKKGSRFFLQMWPGRAEKHCQFVTGFFLLFAPCKYCSWLVKQNSGFSIIFVRELGKNLVVSYDKCWKINKIRIDKNIFFRLFLYAFFFSHFFAFYAFP